MIHIIQNDPQVPRRHTDWKVGTGRLVRQGPAANHMDWNCALGQAQLRRQVASLTILLCDDLLHSMVTEPGFCSLPCPRMRRSSTAGALRHGSSAAAPTLRWKWARGSEVLLRVG